MDTLVKSFRYDAAVEKIWHALTCVKQMRQWYFPQLQQFEPVEGYKFKFKDDGSEFQKEWTVINVVYGKTLAHSWAYKGYKGMSEVIFDLSKEAEITILTVTQTGLESFPDDPHFRRERFESGWDNLLGQNLRGLLSNSQ